MVVGVDTAVISGWGGNACGVFWNTDFNMSSP